MTLADRPDYIPPFWKDSRLNRPLERDPRLVIAWFVVLPLVSLLVGVLFLSAGEVLIAGLVLGAGVVLVLQGLVYVPRAARAARSKRQH